MTTHARPRGRNPRRPHTVPPHILKERERRHGKPPSVDYSAMSDEERDRTLRLLSGGDAGPESEPRLAV